jgi:hypothetical protein
MLDTRHTFHAQLDFERRGGTTLALIVFAPIGPGCFGDDCAFFSCGGVSSFFAREPRPVVVPSLDPRGLHMLEVHLRDGGCIWSLVLADRVGVVEEQLTACTTPLCAVGGEAISSRLSVVAHHCGQV